MRITLINLIATGFGLGRLPKAPGTWGSLGALVLFALIGPFSHAAIQSALTVIFFVLGIWAAGHYAATKKERDPKEIVIDEIAGQWLALVGFKVTLLNLLLAFFFFRLFDIWKPLPIRLGEKLPGGLGIMTDDIMAGIAAHFAVECFNRFLLT